MNGFHGEYEATADPKGRFLLPGALKKQLPEGEVKFILSRGFENCLTLYPMKTWENILEKFNITPDDDTPFAILAATDADGTKLAQQRVPASFSLSEKNATQWVQAGYRIAGAKESY